MAEDNANDLKDDNVSEDEYRVRKRIDKEGKKKEKPCRTRFDVLATPHKRAILDVYQNHSHRFPKEKVQMLKQKLQELYAMIPEETEKYFEQLRGEANEIAKQKMMKIMLKNMYNKKLREKQIRKAYKFIEKLLKQGMMHAFNVPVPPLISVRLRNLSDIILEQISDLRSIDIPERDDPDQVGAFLVAVSDWIAIAIEHIYYGVQLKKNEELTEIEGKAKSETKDKKKKEKTVEKVEKEKEREDEVKEKDRMIQGGEDDMTEPDFE